MRATTPVEVRVVDLDGPDDAAGVLTDDETARAARFVSPRDARRFRVGRAALRHVVAGHTGRGAADVRFGAGPFGKPFLTDAAGVHFSFSRSGGTALVAVAAVPIGIDIERAAPAVAESGVAEAFFAAAEVEALRSLPLSQQQTAFLRCWTRKEAVVKADGRGLRVPLDRFVVTVGADETAAVEWTDPLVLGPASSWSVVDLSARVPGGVAALAARASDLVPRVRPFVAPSTTCDPSSENTCTDEGVRT